MTDVRVTAALRGQLRSPITACMIRACGILYLSESEVFVFFYKVSGYGARKLDQGVTIL
jgi:hypothetical protein